MKTKSYIYEKKKKSNLSWQTLGQPIKPSWNIPITKKKGHSQHILSMNKQIPELWKCPRCNFVGCSCLWIIKGVPWTGLLCWSLARSVCRGVTEKTSLIPFDVPLGCVYWLKMKNLESQSGTLLTYCIILSWQAFASESNFFLYFFPLFIFGMHLNDPSWLGKHMFKLIKSIGA